MLDFILKVLLAVLACVGLVETVSWIAVRGAAKYSRILRVFPIGGEGKNTGKQMAAMYACLQWEANPSRQALVLCDMGLDEQGRSDCMKLAESAGVAFVKKGELETFLVECQGR